MGSRLLTLRLLCASRGSGDTGSWEKGGEDHECIQPNTDLHRFVCHTRKWKEDLGRRVSIDTVSKRPKEWGTKTRIFVDLIC